MIILENTVLISLQKLNTQQLLKSNNIESKVFGREKTISTAYTTARPKENTLKTTKK